MIGIRYHFGRKALEQVVHKASDQSCVKDRNENKYHGGMVKRGADMDPNTRAAVIGMLGEIAYCRHFGIPYEFSGYEEFGDPGFDIKVDGFKVDVKTRSRPSKEGNVVGYVRSVMESGRRLPLDLCDYYFFASLEWLYPESAAIMLQGGIHSEDVLLLEDIESPVSGCSHMNKVVRRGHLDRFTLVDLWN